MNELIKTNEPTVPGIGMGGIVICPYLKSPCMKSGCELWVELNYVDKKVARCAVAWDAILKVELREEIEKLKNALAPQPKKGKHASS